MARRKSDKLGDCYEAAVQFVMSECMFGDCPYIIVHAEVAGQGPLDGVQYGHAYVVDTTTDTVIDRSNGGNIRMPRAVYEAIGNIKRIDNFFEYEWREAKRNLVLYRHYGPWDLETSSGL
jgi:hypothetical protein